MKNIKNKFLVLIVAIICIASLFFLKKWPPVDNPTVTHNQQPGLIRIIEKPHGVLSSNHPKIKYPIELSAKQFSDSAINNGPLPKVDESDPNFQHWTGEFFGQLDITEVLLFNNFSNRTA